MQTYWAHFTPLQLKMNLNGILCDQHKVGGTVKRKETDTQD